MRPNSPALTKFVTITNVTFQVLEVKSATISPADVFAIRGWQGPVVLNPAAQFQLEIGFTPHSTGNSEGVVTLSLEALGSPAPPSNGLVGGAPNTSGSTIAVSSSRPLTIQRHDVATIHVYGSAATDRRTGRIRVVVSPTSTKVASGGSAQFTSSVAGTDNQGVTWSAALGSITASGLYTAPTVSNSAVDTISAVSTADPTKYSTASVFIQATSKSPSGISVSISPAAATVTSGGSAQFTATVSGTSNQNATWSAVLGSVTASGSYSAPTVSSSVTDTVSAISTADPTKFSSVSVSIESSQIWTADNQQPVTMEYYPSTIFTTPLPADVGNHLLNNSDAIVSNIQHGSDCPFAPNCNTGGVLSVIDTTPGGDTAAAKNDFYYSSSSDPVYKVVSCGPAPTQSSNNPNGKYFHLWNQAQFSSDNNDTWLIDWDQSSDLDSTSGGRIISFYYFDSATQHRQLPNCTCHTRSCADTTSSCQLVNYYYCDMGYPFQDTKAYDDGTAYSSAHYATAVGLLRANEIISGTVNHALILNFYCDNPGPSFPATGDVANCNDYPGRDPSLAPHNGALLWIDSGYDCNSLPGWQRGVCKAMQTYGGYLTDTGQDGLYIARIETQNAEHDAGMPDPLPVFQYLAPQSGSNGLSCSGSPVTRCNMPFFNMPGLITGHHLHILDPCVPKQMAGLTTTCTGSPTD